MPFVFEDEEQDSQEPSASSRFIFEDEIDTEAADYFKAPAAGGLKASGYGVRGIGQFTHDLGDKLRTTTNDVFGTDFQPDEDMLRGAGDYLTGLGNKVEQSYSPGAKAAIAGFNPTGNVFEPEGEFSFGENVTPQGVGLRMLDTFGQIAPIAATALVTRGGGMVGQIGKSAGVAAAMGGGAASVEEGDRIRQMVNDPVKLSSVPAYRALREEGVDHENAVEDVARIAESGAFWHTAPVSALTGVLMGGALSNAGQRALSKIVGTGTVARILGGAAIAAPLEGAQEVAELSAQQYGASQATGEPREIGEGSFGEALIGAMGGAGTAALGGAFPVRGGLKKSEPVDLLQPETPFPDLPGEEQGTSQAPDPRFVFEDETLTPVDHDPFAEPAQQERPTIYAGLASQEELFSQLHRQRVNQDYGLAERQRQEQIAAQEQAARESGFKQAEQARRAERDAMVDQTVRADTAQAREPTALELAFQRAQQKKPSVTAQPLDLTGTKSILQPQAGFDAERPGKGRKYKDLETALRPENLPKYLQEQAGFDSYDDGSIEATNTVPFEAGMNELDAKPEMAKGLAKARNKAQQAQHTMADGSVMPGASHPSDQILASEEQAAPQENQDFLQPQNAQPEYAGPDRRTDAAKRKKISEMSQDEMRAALLTSDVTGMPSRRAYEDAPKRPVQVSVDADALKWINDNMGPSAGDDLLRSIGKAMQDETPDSFHFSGDEFLAQADTEEEASALMQKVNERLKKAVIIVQKPDGTKYIKQGLEVTHGTGPDKESADYNLKRIKQEREDAGLRPKRGNQPPGVVIELPQGKQDRQRQAAAEEVAPQASSVDPVITDALTKYGQSKDKFHGYLRGRLGKTKFARRAQEIEQAWAESKQADLPRAETVTPPPEMARAAIPQEAPAVVAVTDVYGKKHYVAQDKLEDTSVTKLRRFNADGSRKINSLPLNRENLDVSGERRADHWKDFPIFDNKGKGYSNENTVKLAIRSLKQPVESYDIQQHEKSGRWFAVKKPAPSAVAENVKPVEQKGKAPVVKESLTAQNGPKLITASELAQTTQAQGNRERIDGARKAVAEGKEVSVQDARDAGIESAPVGYIERFGRYEPIKKAPPPAAPKEQATPEEVRDEKRDPQADEGRNAVQDAKEKEVSPQTTAITKMAEPAVNYAGDARLKGKKVKVKGVGSDGTEVTAELDARAALADIDTQLEAARSLLKCLSS